MAAQNFKEEDWGDGDTKLGQNWHKNFQACMKKRNKKKLSGSTNHQITEFVW